MNKSFVIFSFIAALLFVLIDSLETIRHSMSFLVGWSFMMLNFWTVSKTWTYVLKKKSIALGVIIIVLKYPILFFILRLILKNKDTHTVFFVLGLVVYSFSDLVVKKMTLSMPAKKGTVLEEIQ